MVFTKKERQQRWENKHGTELVREEAIARFKKMYQNRISNKHCVYCDKDLVSEPYFATAMQMRYCFDCQNKKRTDTHKQNRVAQLVCCICKIDITNRHPGAIYCTSCALLLDKYCHYNHCTAAEGRRVLQKMAGND